MTPLLKKLRSQFGSRKARLRVILLERDNNTCQKCGFSPDNHNLKTIFFGYNPYFPPRLEVDHVVPLSKGGSNKLDNLQVLCNKCNCSKGVNIGNNFQFSKKHISNMLKMGYDIINKRLVDEQI